MLTYFFILTLIFAELGGGGTAQMQVNTSSEELCKALRRAIMTQLPDMNGHASLCHELGVLQPVLPEMD